MLYPWLKPYWHDIQQQMTSNRLHHALFLTSSTGMGKLALAKQLAKTLLCKEPVGWEPCEHCHSCQLFETSVHPDFHFVSADDGKVIGVDRVREISQRLQVHAHLSGSKVVIFENAGNFNLASANALLKTLEEPSDGSYIILLGESKSAVLPTINSRCQKMHISAPSENETLSWLQTQFPISQPDLPAIRVNQGAPLHTLRFLNNGDDLLRQTVFEELKQLHYSPSAVKIIADILSEHSLDRINWLQFILLDLQKLKAKVAVSYIINSDHTEWLSAFAEKIDIDVIFQLQHLLSELKDMLTSNANLTVETVMLSYLIKLKRLTN